MDAGDTIKLLTQYNAGAKSNPRENRLTAALVALLSQSGDLGANVAEAWIGRKVAPGEVAIRMQRPVGGRVGWVDLELEVTGSRRALIWVEVKLEHRLSGSDQLRKYRDRLDKWKAGTPERLVLLLAPAQRAEKFPGIAPLSDRAAAGDRGPYFVSWQSLYATLSRRPERRLRPQVEWLRREVLGYMAKEELEPSELKPRHLHALQTRDEAYAALQAVVERAQATLRGSRWRGEPNAKKPTESYWEHRYKPALPGSPIPKGTRAKLVWGVSGRYAFAGVYFRRENGGAVRPARDEEWRIELLQKRDDAGYEQDDTSDRAVVWVGLDNKDLADLVKRGRTVEKQGDDLAAFVSETFMGLLRARPRSSR